MSRIEAGVSPAVIGERVDMQDGSVEYRLTMVRAELGQWQTGIGTVGIKRLQLDQREPSVTVDVRNNEALQGASSWVEDRTIFINPNTQGGADKISGNASLLLDTARLNNSNGS